MSAFTRTKHLLAATALAGAGVAALTALAPAASAATPAAPAASAAYNGACGAGYKVVNQAPVTGKGTAYLTYSTATGKNCVVMIRTTTGDPVPMELYLGLAGSEIHDNYDVGDYRSYAGPLYVDARGACVDWWGRLDGTWFGRYGTNCG
ncbi:spore-associated protein A [Streptomyces sp. NPDC049813]|uniref:spore-associated protein A n=1 Tax=Streptomyces sp. NPDC049813 TaxID=3365597 RepID=UPI00379B4798